MKETFWVRRRWMLLSIQKLCATGYAVLRTQRWQIPQPAFAGLFTMARHSE
jgi:hypothetical protein